MPANASAMTAFLWVFNAILVLVPAYLVLAYRTWPSRALRIVILGVAILIVRSAAPYVISEYRLDPSQGAEGRAILVPNMNHAMLGLLELVGRAMTIFGVVALWRTKSPDLEAIRSPANEMGGWSGP